MNRKTSSTASHGIESVLNYLNFKEWVHVYFTESEQILVYVRQSVVFELEDRFRKEYTVNEGIFRPNFSFISKQL